MCAVKANVTVTFPCLVLSHPNLSFWGLVFSSHLANETQFRDTVFCVSFVTFAEPRPRPSCLISHFQNVLEYPCGASLVGVLNSHTPTK